MTTDIQLRPFSAAAFNAYLSEHKLMAARCEGCQTLYIPPRTICPNCHSAEMKWVELSGKGKLAGFTVVYVAPTAMIAQGFSREKPYIAGIVELDEGPKISARIVGFDASHPELIQIGSNLSIAYLDVGESESKKTYLGFQAT